MINLNTSLAIGAAVEAPDPPCSITTDKDYLGISEGL